MRTLRLTPRAGEDFQRIHDWVAHGAGDDAAADLCRAIYDLIGDVVENPQFGHHHAWILSPRALVRRVHSYLVIYEYDDDRVVVLRVVHGAMDLRKLKLR